MNGGSRGQGKGKKTPAVYKETNNFQTLDCIGINAKHEEKNCAW